MGQLKQQEYQQKIQLTFTQIFLKETQTSHKVMNHPRLPNSWRRFSLISVTKADKQIAEEAVADIEMFLIQQGKYITR